MTALDMTLDLDAPFQQTEAANIPTAPTCRAYAADAAARPLEGGTDPTFGTVRWRTLIDGKLGQSAEFVLGIAEFEAGGTLLPHRHDPAEFYFGLDGTGIVTIDGIAHSLSAGVALYIPGNAEHGVVAGDGGLRFAYGFAESRFEEILYRFAAAAPDRGEPDEG